MPYIVPGRGFTQYDSQGNFWGYFPTGNVPPCPVTGCSEDRSCPTGAIDCQARRTPRCPSGYTCVTKVRSPWSSCNKDSGILF